MQQVGPTDDCRPHLLFLCHRFPFPPNKGDKIRSYNLLRYLAARYRVHLGAFVDEPSDWGHRDVVARLCSSVHLEVLHPRRRRLASLRGFVTGQALSVPYYHSRSMGAWVTRIRDRHGIRRVVVFSSPMAQYVMGSDWSATRRVMDFVDVDSDKWSQYARAKPVHTAWIYRREAARLQRFEIRAAREATACTFVSPEEAALFEGLVGDSGVAVDSVPNGVDAEYFDPATPMGCPYADDGRRRIVFTGAMDYWANEDAVRWFVADVLPEIRRQHQGSCTFYIVGMNPTRDVLQLAGPDVVVTGAVDDVRPYLRHADVIVAPMRIARGIQNKVLEGMAMARPVITTARGAEGLAVVHGEDVLIADTAGPYAAAVGQVLDGQWPSLGAAARKSILTSYAWEASLQAFGAHIDPRPVAA